MSGAQPYLGESLPTRALQARRSWMQAVSTR